ncbi:MAG: exodeoxyribonuclease VII large subunit [Oscillospiraceae bacterium]|nr:exodeoxyribonuclease VII large subunit [Oscillospiraceae bacterium]
MNRAPISVSALNLYIKSLIGADSNLSDVLVSGEISGFKHHFATGHFYFDLKDNASSVRVVMFSSYAKGISFTPENGMKVIIKGRIGVFEKGGTYQIYAASMEPEGLGNLYLQFLALKERLEKEGLFDSSRKRAPKKMPQKIAVITSKTGAVIKDIENVLSRRFPLCKIILFPATVQGETAVQSIAEAFDLVNSEDNIDTVILARGGGSQNDLWCFNDERVVRAVASCRYPVISAVGHETDVTLSDFAADLRAPTPSAAAELAASDIKDISAYILSDKSRMNSALETAVLSGEQRMKTALSFPLFRNPEEFFDEKAANLLFLTQRIMRGVGFLDDKQTERIKNLKERINIGAKNYIDKKEMLFKSLVSSLCAMNPMGVLSRGFAAVSINGKIFSSVKEVKTDDILKIHMSDGELSAKVLERAEYNE